MEITPAFIADLCKKYTNKTPFIEPCFMHLFYQPSVGLISPNKESHPPILGTASDAPKVWYFGDITIQTHPFKDTELYFYSPVEFGSEPEQEPRFTVVSAASHPHCPPFVKLENFILEHIKVGTFIDEGKILFTGYKIIFN